jgi:glutaredoxin
MSKLTLLFIALVAYGGYDYYGKQRAQQARETAAAAAAAQHPQLVRVENERTQGRRYVAVYGRQTCGYTRAMMQHLDNAGIRFTFLDIDDRVVANDLHARMRRANIDTSHYLLPVVELNESIAVRPEPTDTVMKYRMSL